jgi:N-acetylglucosaminyldiphosphoundecaprenol N-acetyl-beta-D-mannosaminyltransferase
MTSVSDPDPRVHVGYGEPNAGVGCRVGRVRLAGIAIDRLTEAEVIEQIFDSIRSSRGGWVFTPNIDICRLVGHDSRLQKLVSSASLVVPDGTPLLWAATLRGDPLAERVTGSSLIYSLTAAAAERGRSIYLLGGDPHVPARAAGQLRCRYPGLLIAGTDAPPIGFDMTDGGIDIVRARLAATAPDIVYVGLGFPKQERLAALLAPTFPTTWFVGCGAAIPFVAGVVPRAPRWMQRAGAEWLFRLAKEPRRLSGRYLVHDLPFAAQLLLSCAAERYRPRWSVTRGPGSHPAAAARKRDPESGA